MELFLYKIFKFLVYFFIETIYYYMGDKYEEIINRCRLSK